MVHTRRVPVLSLDVPPSTDIFRLPRQGAPPPDGRDGFKLLEEDMAAVRKLVSEEAIGQTSHGSP